MKYYICFIALNALVIFIFELVIKIKKDSCDHLESYEEWNDEYHIEACTKCKKEFWRIEK